MNIASNWKDYEILDMANGEKLERWKDVILVRPDPVSYTHLDVYKRQVYYACTKEDAGNIGFRDDIIYKYLEGKNEKLINLKQIDKMCIRDRLL